MISTNLCSKGMTMSTCITWRDSFFANDVSLNIEISRKYGGYNSGNEVWGKGARLMLHPSTEIASTARDVVHYNADANILAVYDIPGECISRENGSI